MPKRAAADSEAKRKRRDFQRELDKEVAEERKLDKFNRELERDVEESRGEHEVSFLRRDGTPVTFSASCKGNACKKCKCKGGGGGRKKCECKK